MGSSLSKLALSAGSTAGEQRRHKIWACGGRDANHYSFGVQTPRARLGCSLI